MSWSVTADYEFGGGETKRKCLNIRSVYAGEPPSTNGPVAMLTGSLEGTATAASVQEDGSRRLPEAPAYNVPTTLLLAFPSSGIGPVFVHGQA